MDTYWRLNILNIRDAIIQGIIQGLTEFLPISSSGHLSLVQYFTGQNGSSGILFSILLHMGTLLAVFLAFYKTIFALVVEFFMMIADVFRGRFSLKDANPHRRMILLLIVSLLPMALSFFLLDTFNKIATDDSIVAEGVCFLITSVLLFISDACTKCYKTAQNMKYRDAVAIGVTQALAPFPGISRSGSTISVGLMMGLDRKFAVAFSFIMGIPTILGANIMELSDAAKEGVSIPVPVLLIGIVTALLVGLLAIKMVNWLVTSDKFKYFAWYTLILGLLTIGVGIFENASGHVIRDIVLYVIS